MKKHKSSPRVISSVGVTSIPQKSLGSPKDQTERPVRPLCVSHSQALRISRHPSSLRVSPARLALSIFRYAIRYVSILRTAIEILRLCCRRFSLFPGGSQVLSRRFPPGEAIKAITARDCPSPSRKRGRRVQKCRCLAVDGVGKVG